MVLSDSAHWYLNPNHVSEREAERRGLRPACVFCPPQPNVKSESQGCGRSTVRRVLALPAGALDATPSTTGAWHGAACP